MGSGGAVRLNGQNLTCNISDSVMNLNTAELDGGGIYIALGPRVRVNGVSFVGNEVFRGGAPAIFAVVCLSLQVQFFEGVFTVDPSHRSRSNVVGR